MVTHTHKDIAAVDVWHNLNAQGRLRVLSGLSPVVIRGLVSDWSIVDCALTSFNALKKYCLSFDKGLLFEAMLASSDEKGRLFYGEDLTQFNFDRMNGYLKDAFDILESLRSYDNSPTFYIGSKEISHYLPGLERECRLSFLDESIIPNIWIGNRTLVATHNDDSQNIACIAAGRRKFTLFPPDQKENLYIAKADISPGGRPISLVDLKAPDFTKFPRFADALTSAQVAVLEPGDALYIPTNWWHHVEALDDVNILINFWWQGNPPSLDTLEMS